MKQKIDEDLLEKFDKWCEINQKYFKDNGKFNATLLTINRNGNAIVMMLLFRNYKEKRIMMNGLKLLALSQKNKGYFFASDTKLTIMSKEKKPKVYDALVQLLCSPRGSIQRIMFHDGKGNEIKINEFNDGMLEQYDVKSEWDVYGESIDIDNKAIKEYNKFKEKNPQLFKEVM